MSSYLVAPESIRNGRAVIEGDEAHHAAKVARRQGVELGVSAIWPLETAHSVVRGPSRNRVLRWKSISLAATKQCLRSRIPEVAEPISLGDTCSRFGGFDAVFVAWERESSEALAPGEKLTGSRYLVVIGPEGGFTEQEISLLRSSATRMTTLGPRRLRTETAGICAVALIMDRSDAGV